MLHATCRTLLKGVVTVSMNTRNDVLWIVGICDYLGLVLFPQLQVSRLDFQASSHHGCVFRSSSALDQSRSELHSG